MHFTGTDTIVSKRTWKYKMLTSSHWQFLKLYATHRWYYLTQLFFIHKKRFFLVLWVIIITTHVYLKVLRHKNIQKVHVEQSLQQNSMQQKSLWQVLLLIFCGEVSIWCSFTLFAENTTTPQRKWHFFRKLTTVFQWRIISPV